MASRRDLLQSYQFMVQRVISGVVLRETDPVNTPLRKMSGSGFASVMVAVVVLAGSALIGIFWPSGNTTWQAGDKVIVEEETGATFVWLQVDEKAHVLYPTANFASAALLVGTREVVNVSHESLLGVPRGPLLGIPGAPDSLPEPDLMLQGDWTLCSLPTREVDGALVPNTALVVGRDTTEGSAIDDRATFVKDVTLNTLHVIWNGHQFPITDDPNDERAVLEALVLQTTTPINVGTAWLNAVPRGDVLQPNPVPERGQVSTAISHGIVGEIRVVEGGARRQYYQVAATQIIEITEVQAKLLLADDDIRATVYNNTDPVALPLSSDEAQQASRVELGDPGPTDAPRTVPEFTILRSADPTICASFGPDQVTPAISVDASVDGTENATATHERTQSGTVLADHVLVEPGHAAIVEEQSSHVRYLVTDDGRRYRLASADAQALLGYAGIDPIALPESLIARVPAGAMLDPLAARTPVD